MRASRHSLRGDTGHQYDATGRILQTRHAVLGGVGSTFAQAANESFQYDPAGNILDPLPASALGGATQQASQRGYVRDNLVRVFEDKRYFYDGHGRLTLKLSGRHTRQHFHWNEENQLTAVDTIRRPGTEHETCQTTHFEYDAIGKRIAKRDAFGTTEFIWEGMRLIEERRGASVISYVYEPGSYVPLARLDVEGNATNEGGLGTIADVEPHVQLPVEIDTKEATPRGGPQREAANMDIAGDLPPASSPSVHIANGTTGRAKACDVYYFHTDQIGMPQELSNAQGQLVWQASYKTWGATVSEEWEVTTLAGQREQSLDCGDIPTDENERQQNLRFQGQYLDRETGLHYNTFRYYDADIGRFVCPDPIGLAGGVNLASYGPNAVTWSDPWGWAGNPANATHITYVGIKDGKPYVGYASKPGLGHSAQDVLDYRYPNKDIFDQAPKPIYRGEGVDGKHTARGLEQRTFESYEGIGADGKRADGTVWSRENAITANKQNPVGANNPNRSSYLNHADAHNSGKPNQGAKGC
ncbi:hypothetical protein SDC9_106636 [bioreactor metagenome]|uniref:RHS protein conserved region domain-containing protein n=1 Tax=bioreactor metagenome TaxID=1076179 RepID=A0A645B2V3_9ZZZZ